MLPLTRSPRVYHHIGDLYCAQDAAEMGFTADSFTHTATSRLSSPLLYPPTPSFTPPLSPAASVSPRFPLFPSDSQSVSRASPSFSPGPQSGNEAQPAYASCFAASALPLRSRRNARSAEQRAQQRKLAHKRMDASRRQRETTAVLQLHQLSDMADQDERDADDGRMQTAATAREKEERAAEEEKEAADDSRRAERKAEAELKRDKVSVLERAVVRMQRLHDGWRRLRRDNAQQAEIIARLRAAMMEMQESVSLSTVTAASSLLPASPSSPASASSLLDSPSSASSSPVEPSQLQSLMQAYQSHTLLAVVRSPLAMCIIALSSLSPVDCNLHHTVSSGWPPSLILHKRLFGSKWIAGSSAPSLSESDISCLCPLTHRMRGGTVQHALQYDRTKAEGRALLQGAAKKVETLWRVYLSDGGLYEVSYTIWLGGMERCRDAETGVDVMRPQYVVAACSFEDAVRVAD